MTCNVGNKERYIRLVIGFIIIALGLIFGSWWGLLGLVLVGTAVVRWCPVNHALKWNTCERKEPEIPHET